MKRFLGVMFVLLGTFLLPVYAEASAPPEPYHEDVTYYRDEETGFIRAEYGEEEETVEIEGTVSAFVPYKALPSSFSSIADQIATFPATRDQNPYGTCWAFATTACAEYDLIKNHGASKSIDLSELQLAYYTYHTANDKLGNLDGDENYIPYYAPNNFMEVGGTADYAMQTLASWKGLTYESTLPYSSASDALYSGLSSTYATSNDGALMTHAIELNMSKNTTAIKNAIRNYGAVAASYGSWDSYYNELAGSYANYYCPYSYGTNHEIAIVGWDNNYPVSKFKYTPSAPGAWLVRNSWTTAAGESQYSYFWLSYEDKTLSDYVVAYDFVPGGTYDNNYQHDGAVTHVWWEVNGYANVFVAENPDGYKSEVLKAVMLAITTDGAEKVKVQIYTGLTDKTKPTSGTLQSSATTTATIQNSGIHTIKLNRAVPLIPGERFAVVVTPVDGMATLEFECTQNVTYYENNNLTAWFNTVASLDRNESFYKWAGKWDDVADSGYSDMGNACIKALTTNSSTKAYKISYQLNGGTNKTANPKRYTASQGSITLKTPTKKGYYFQGWYTNSSYTNKITKLSGDLGKNLTLYAKWRKMDYDITLSSKKLVYNGENRYPTVTVKDEYGNKLTKGTDYTLSFKNNKSVGRGWVVVTFKGLPYSLKETVYFSIVPKAPSSASASLYGYNDVKFSWKKASYADGYKVYYKKSTASSYKLYKDTTSTSVKIANLDGGIKYTFKVVPYFISKSGTKYLSTKYTTATERTLKKIEKPTVTLSGSKVKVTWKNIYGETGYQISKSTKQSGTNIVSTYKTTSGKSKTFTATFGKAYYYKVRAYKVVNDKKIYGPWSTAVKYTRHLAAPSTVKSSLYGYDDVKVTWSKVSGAAGYSVYYKKSSASSYKLKGNTANLSMKIANLEDGVKYQFKVVPYTKNDGTIVRSSNYKTTTLTTLKKVVLSSVSAEGTNVKVTWENIAGETGYQISQAASKTQTNIVATFATTSGTSKVLAAEPGKLFYYKIRAYKTVGDTKIFGPWSAVLSAEVPEEGSITLSASATGNTTCLLTASTYPANAQVTWTSSNTAVATVYQGLVTAKGNGTAIITATIEFNGKTYSASKTITVNNTIQYGNWSGWTLTPAYASSSLEVQTTPMYRYYCFYCSACGGREPFSGYSDCGALLPSGSWQEIWSAIPYSQCGGTRWQLASSKMYTTSLGDGLLWNFGSASLYATAIGTTDPGSGAVIIKQGYRSRSVTTKYWISGVY